jgi:hypothetical protein
MVWDPIIAETWTRATRPHIGHDKLSSVAQPAHTLLATTEAQNQVTRSRLLDVVVRGQSREHTVCAGQGSWAGAWPAADAELPIQCHI